MKKSFPLLFLFFTLVGCSTDYLDAPKFDSNEYLLVALIKQNAKNGIKDCSDNPYHTVLTDGQRVFDAAQTFEIYSEHLENNQDSHKMALGILDISKNFVEKSTKDISKTYCIEKFTNITESSDNILKALATKGRN